MRKGELIPDEVVGSLIEEWLHKVMPGKRILFDGFPRTRYQAQTMPLIEYYGEANLLVEIDGTGELSEVTNRAMTVLKSLDVAEKVTHQ